MATRIDIPVLNEPLNAETMLNWLTKCDDQFELYELLSDKKLADRTKILAASGKFGSQKLSTFYAQERDALLAGGWVAFKTKVKAHVLGNVAISKVDALEAWYSLAQGRRTFTEFLVDVDARRATLASFGSGSPFHIPDFLYKSTLLFRCNRLLSLRI